jgi:hypothetical protein
LRELLVIVIVDGLFEGGRVAGDGAGGAGFVRY